MLCNKSQVQRLVGKGSLTLSCGLRGSGYPAAIAGGGVGLFLLLTQQGLPVFPRRFISYRSLMAIMNGQSSTATVTSMTCMKR